MENVENDSDGFFKYVFDLNDANKASIMNMLQYTILAFIPVILVLKVTKSYVPEANEEKGSLELLAESLFQVIFILLSFWFINRVITYIPTYSKKPYREFNETTFIIGFIFILLTIQTKLGEKISILSDRVIEIWTGDSSIKKVESEKVKVKVSQPLAGHHPSQADNLAFTPMTPPHPVMTNNLSQTHQYSMQNAPNVPARQPIPDFNSMHAGPVTPLPGAAHPTFQEPMAANEAFGGGSFGSAW